MQEFGGHPNIIQLRNVIRAQNDKDIYLIFEYMGESCLVALQPLLSLQIGFIISAAQSTTDDQQKQAVSHFLSRMCVIPEERVF